jgi:hypothetical protein
MIRRSTLKPVVETAPPQEPTRKKFRCGSCGVTIPELRHRPFICSYCAGRPGWGRDGYFEAMIVDEIRMMEAKYGRPFSTGNRTAWFAYLSKRSSWETEPFERRR